MSTLRSSRSSRRHYMHNKPQHANASMSTFVVQLLNVLIVRSNLQLASSCMCSKTCWQLSYTVIYSDKSVQSPVDGYYESCLPRFECELPCKTTRSDRSRSSEPASLHPGCPHVPGVTNPLNRIRWMTCICRRISSGLCHGEAPAYEFGSGGSAGFRRTEGRGRHQGMCRSEKCFV